MRIKALEIPIFIALIIFAKFGIFDDRECGVGEANLIFIFWISSKTIFGCKYNSFIILRTFYGLSYKGIVAGYCNHSFR